MRNIKDSQNYLHNKQIVNDIIKLSNLNRTDTVIEIGPGKGIITEQLALICDKIIAVELDKTHYLKLQNQFANKNVELVSGDFLSYVLPNQPYKIFSNIPFNYTADIIRKVMLGKHCPEDAYLIMQKEAAMKYGGEPYFKESYRSLLIKPFFKMDIIFTFASEDFRPVPNVKIVLSHFHKRETPIVESQSEYRDFIAYAFLQKKSRIKDCFGGLFTYTQLKVIGNNSKFNLKSLITELTFMQWMNLYNSYLKYVCTEKKKNTLNAYRDLTEAQNRLDKQHKTKNSMR